MNAKTNRMRKRGWSLSLIVIMVLHWSFGACIAFADTLCVEPGGKVVWEHEGGPCASDALEKVIGKPCVDLKLDGHADHTPAPAKVLPLLASQAVIFIPALDWLLPATEPAQLSRPDATGPPLAALSVAIRKTTVLLI